MKDKEQREDTIFDAVMKNRRKQWEQPEDKTYKVVRIDADKIEQAPLLEQERIAQ
jgi:hypothetical protein